MRGTFSNSTISTGSSLYASSISQMPRRVSRLSAWYLSVRLLLSAIRPEKPLHGADRNMTCGRSPPKARWMSTVVASRQPAGGSQPQKARYCSRSKRSNTVPGTPAMRLKSAMAAGSTSMPPRQR